MDYFSQAIFFMAIAVHFSSARSHEEWWTYKNMMQGAFVPGPPLWGLVNSAWSLCSIGKRQSPINVNTSQVIYDPFLPPLRLSLSGKKVQMLHYNQELYNNVSEASRSPNGLAVISLFVKVGDSCNPFLSKILSRETMTQISFKGDAFPLPDMKLDTLFPETFGFLTYQGSMSTPPCYETVTWIIIDRPLTVTSVQMHSLRLLSQNLPSHIFHSMSDNSRPTQPLNNRNIRANLDFRKAGVKCQGPNFKLHVDTPMD
nr:PREDICTED: carbonic anhydrase-related protein 11 isoform X2 [Latimeria chalumnae]|eukprot:XP_006005696.1 PREDICTED: carbonic anhydrase-related protein 11 isoform X2 [Latimeria chalumnae]